MKTPMTKEDALSWANALIKAIEETEGYVRCCKRHGEINTPEQESEEYSNLFRNAAKIVEEYYI